ncbi:MAG TPA: hypothetical protein VF733_03030 [Candidatus Saccharimonadales bacterium]
MNILRRIGLGLATLAFGALLTALPPLIGLFMVFNQSGPLKNALRQSGLYESAASVTIDKQAGQQDAQLALDNAAIRQAVVNAFPPAYLQTTAEKNIDSIYSWVHGDTKEPQLGINLEQPRQLLSENIGTAVKQKLDGLPVCKERRSAPTTPAELMALDCKPPNIPDAALIEAARNQALTSSLFAKTTEQMGTLKDENGQPVTAKFRVIPEAYRYMVWSLFIVPLALIVMALAIICWSPTKQIGIKRVGAGLITNGVFSSILALGAVWGLTYATRFIIDQDRTLATLQGKVLESVKDLAVGVRNWWLVVSVGYIIIGIALLIMIRLRQINQTEHNKSLNESMGYRNDVPRAGTTFITDEKSTTYVTQEHIDHSRADHQTRSAKDYKSKGTNT